MAGFLVLNNMGYGVMAKEELVVLSTKIPSTPLYDDWNGAMHECNYSQRSYTMVYDAARHAVWQTIDSVMRDAAKQFWKRSS
jgi:hypothetical protein